LRLPRFLAYLSFEGGFRTGDRNRIVRTQNTRVASLALNDESFLAKRIIWDATITCDERRVIDVISTYAEDRVRCIRFGNRVNLESACSG